MNAIVKSHIALFFVALIYGANYSIAKEVMNDGFIQPLGFILMRVICAFILFQVFHRVFIKEKVEHKDMLRLAFCGLFGVAVNQMFFFSGLYYTKPINAALIMTSTPILVMLISNILIREKITPRKITGVLLGALGAILLISFGKSLSFQSEQMLGDFMILINATSYGLYLVLVKDLMKRYHPLTVVKWVFSFGLVFVIPFGARQLGSIEWQSFTPAAWLALGYVLIFTTFFAYLLNAFALKTVNPTTASMYIYLQPLMASGIALLFGTDDLNVMKVIAGLLIFSGVYLVSMKSTRQSENLKN